MRCFINLSKCKMGDPIRFSEIITRRMTPDDPTDDQTQEQALAAGLTGVCARHNTRETLWLGMAFFLAEAAGV